MQQETASIGNIKPVDSHHVQVWQWVVTGIGIIFLLCYITIAVLRMQYPYELQWIEGCSVDHLIRAFNGQPLYIRPSIEFTPYIYTPLYFYVSALMAKFTGIGFVPLRLVSFIASLVCFVTIYALVRRETGEWLAGFISATLFAATYGLTSAWFDLARVDMLALCLLLTALYCLRYARGTFNYFLGAILIVLAYFTKQTMLICAVPLLLIYYGIWHRKQLAVLLPTIILSIAIGIVSFNAATHGWFTLYCLVLPQQHPIVPIKFISFWGNDTLPHLPIAALAVLSLFWGRYNANIDQRRWYGCLLLGMVGGSWVARLHSGGYINVVIPTYAALAIFTGLATTQIMHTMQRRSNWRPRWLLWLCPLQFLFLLYNPAAYIPSAADRAAGDAFIKLLAQYPGEVYVPYHSYIPTLAGKRSYAHATTVFDVLRAHQPRLQRALNNEIHAAIRSHRFSAIILDRDDFDRRVISTYYTRAGDVFPDRHVFLPVSGLPFRPEYIYIPKK